MRKITVEDVQEFRDWLRKRPSVKGGNLSEVTINRQMIFLGKMFDCAIKAKFRTDNPCRSIRKLSQIRSEFDYYTPEMFKLFDTFFEESEYSFQLYYRVLMYSGVRSGEALALTWEQVNLNEAYIDVKRTAHYKNKEVILGPVKTKESERRIYIHKAFVDELKSWKFKQLGILGKFIDDPENYRCFNQRLNI